MNNGQIDNTSYSVMIEAAAVAAKALRRSLKTTKRVKKNAIRRRKEARSEGVANATASIARARSLSLGEWFAKNQGCAS